MSKRFPYRLGFDPWALALFAIVLLPTILWSFFPAPNDVLRVESSLKALDELASMCQMLMITALCCLIRPGPISVRRRYWLVPMVLCVLAYFGCWGLYYAGSVDLLVILGMTVLPCLAFFCYAFYRRHWLAMFPLGVFTLCHVASALIHFIL